MPAIRTAGLEGVVAGVRGGGRPVTWGSLVLWGQKPIHKCGTEVAILYRPFHRRVIVDEFSDLLVYSRLVRVVEQRHPRPDFIL